jgi:hypothetical protein
VDKQEIEPMSPEVAVATLKGTGNSLGMQAEAIAALGKLVESAMPTPYLDSTDDQGHPRAWHFVGYRDGSPEGNRDNSPELAQYQGVIFADGTVAMRWLTLTRSVSTWDCFADMFEAHGRPEYGTRIVWIGEAPAEALEVIHAALREHAERAALAHADDPEFRDTAAEGRRVVSLAELTDAETADLVALQELAGRDRDDR